MTSPMPLLVEPETVVIEPLAFHRLDRARQRPARWWRPIAIGATAAGIFFAVVIAVVLAVIVGALLVPGMLDRVDDVFNGSLALDTPAGFLILVVPLIVMIPALWIASMSIGGRGAGLLLSVAGRLRWSWMMRCFAVSVPIYVVGLGGASLIALMTDGPAAPAPDPGHLFLMLALVVLLIPFQAAAEEYVFRGFLMQAVGTWLKHPAFAIVLPVPLFVIAHGYDVWGQLEIALFALTAGWITWRTGGLEAAIAFHVVNNISVFALGMSGIVDVNSTQGSPLSFLLGAAILVSNALIVSWLANRTGLCRTAAVAPPVAAPVAPVPVTV